MDRAFAETSKGALIRHEVDDWFKNITLPYGTPGNIEEIKRICDAHDALIVEDAAESLGATYKGTQTGTFGDYNAISFNGNNVFKIEGDASFCNKVLNNTCLAA